MKISQIAAKYGLQQYTTKSGKRFWYRDNGAKVLFVGHQDTIQEPGTFQPVQFKTETRIYYPTADDRVGLYVGLCYLPKAKIKVDILITEDEEMGRSTALWFDAPKKYNWMFMFDRQGTGAVTYQYGNEQLHYKLGKHNLYPISHGTYSCIRDLEHLGICGINFGAGYHDNHSEFAYVAAGQLRNQLRKFIDFFKEYQHVRMPHDVGYERFAQAVNYQSYESDREYFEANKIQPGAENLNKAKRESRLRLSPVPVEELFGKGEIVDAEFTVIDDKFKGDPSIDESTFDDWHYKDYGEYRQSQLEIERKEPDKSVYVITEGGKLKRMDDRYFFKLYWPIENLKIDVVHLNILRNTFRIYTVYDLVKQSPFRLVTSGMFEAHEVDNFVKEVQRHGFDLRFNVAGLMKPSQYEKQKANGWKKREKILRTSTAHKKPVPTNKRLEMIGAQKLEEAKAKPVEKKRDPHKHIVLYPLPGTDIAYTLQQMRDLQKAGYDIEARYSCQGCKKDFEFDITKTDQLPNFCPSCQTEPEKVISPVELSNETGAEVFTKIQLRKDATDDTQFEYIGKGGGKGIEKYDWKRPTPDGVYRRDDGADIYIRERILT